MFPESVIRIPAAEYRVTEGVGEVSVPLHRTGDLMDEFMVVCFTKSGKRFNILLAL